MGCDIHAFPEYRDGDEWVSFGEVDLWRNYHIFYALAGVRGPFDGIVPLEPRGLPDDADFRVRDEWSEDGHTPSWVTTDEFAACIIPGNEDYAALLAAMRVFDEARLVFWFDN